MSTLLLKGRDLVKEFRSGGLLRRHGITRALDHVDIDLYEGEILALIGESGSGKTTLGKVLLRLTTLDQGRVEFLGADLFSLNRQALREARRQLQMIFQNQAANLHPKMSVEEMLDESLRLHRPGLDREARSSHIQDLLKRVGLEEHRRQRLSSLSGGERRRVGLARILATKPRLIVADEPTSGLDAAIKLQIIKLLKELKAEQLSYLIISHDLGLVRRIADRVLVMLKGQIIEALPVEVLGAARHPYTERLIRAADLEKGHPPLASKQRESLEGGCIYAAACPLAQKLGILERCRRERPGVLQLKAGHWVACFGAQSPREGDR